jgi:hypothetical protein
VGQHSSPHPERDQLVVGIVADVGAAEIGMPERPHQWRNTSSSVSPKSGSLTGTSLHRPRRIPATWRTPGLLVMWNMERSVDT